MSGSTPNFSAAVTKSAADTPEPGDDFIEDQQNAVGRADFAQALEITDRWNQDAAGTCYGFDDQRRDGVGTIQRNERFEGVGKMYTPAWLAS